MLSCRSACFGGSALARVVAAILAVLNVIGTDVSFGADVKLPTSGEKPLIEVVTADVKDTSLEALPWWSPMRSDYLAILESPFQAIVDAEALPALPIPVFGGLNQNLNSQRRGSNYSFDLLFEFLRQWRRRAISSQQQDTLCMGALKFREAISHNLSQRLRELTAMLEQESANAQVSIPSGSDGSVDIDQLIEEFSIDGKRADAVRLVLGTHNALAETSQTLRAIEASCRHNTFSWAGDRSKTFDSVLAQSLIDAGIDRFSLTGVTIDLDASDQDLRELSLRDVVITRLNLRSARLNSIHIEDSLLATCTIGTCSAVDFRNLQSKHGVTVRDSIVLGWIDAANAEIGGDLVIRNTLINGALNPVSLATRLAQIWEMDTGEVADNEALMTFVEGLRTNRRTGGRALAFHGAQIGGTLTLTDIEAWGKIHLGRLKADELRMAGNHFDGTVDFWGAEFLGPSFIGHTNSGARHTGLTVTGDLSGWYIKADELQLSNVWIGGNLNLLHGELTGRFMLENSHVGGHVRAHGLSAKHVTLLGVAAEEVILNSALVENRLTIRRVATPKLQMHSLRAQDIAMFGPSGRHDNENGLEACSGHKLDQKSPEMPEFGISSQQALDWGLAWNQDEQTTSCIGYIAATRVVLETGFFLAGHVASVVDLAEANLGGTLTLGGPRTTFGANACVWLRDISADTIVLEAQDPTSDTAVRKAPVFVDTFGARYRTIRPSEPIGDVGSREQIVHNALEMQRQEQDMICEEEGYRPARPSDTTFGQLAPAYQPHIYDALARGYEATGHVDLARIVRMEKNRAYAASLPIGFSSDMITKAVYWFADIFTGFGHQNLKGVFYLLFFIALGIFLGSVGEVNLRRGFNWVLRKLALPQIWVPESESRGKIAGNNALPRFKSFSRLALFSTDRAIPTLGLDSDFETHRDEPVRGILSIYFYFQRAICFIIIVLMVGGVFDVFQ